ncbi:protein jag [Rubritalea marina]|uniref:Jag family protein n=1 Tax=Rubritalea marina TaxID=361055 RepID=UPI000365F2E6|nr:R3H domain-containing nucleic acid-binding protein [Rubritalea marina]
MTWEDAAEKILVTMLGHLGFEVGVKREQGDDGLCLQVVYEDSKLIIGRNGDRLEDLQYLLNRTLNKHYPDAPRVKVDCDNYRSEQEAKLIEKARELAVRVASTGKSARTRPLNAYYRRVVHNALTDIEGVATQSPKSDARYKRIEITPQS